MMAFCFAISVNAQSDLYNKCNGMKGITTVYIPKTMLKMGASLGGSEDMDLKKISNKLDNLQVIVAEKKESVVFLKKESMVYGTGNGYDLLISVNDSGEKVEIYQKSLKKGTNQFIIKVEDSPSEMTVIIMEGNLTAEDVVKSVKID